MIIVLTCTIEEVYKQSLQNLTKCVNNMGLKDSASKKSQKIIDTGLENSASKKSQKITESISKYADDIIELIQGPVVSPDLEHEQKLSSIITNAKHYLKKNSKSIEDDDQIQNIKEFDQILTNLTQTLSNQFVSSKFAQV
jgi:hypothetical protein